MPIKIFTALVAFLLCCFVFSFGHVALATFLGAVLFFGLSGILVVRQQTCAVIERFGRFLRIAQPGLNWRVPIVDRVLAKLSFRIQQLDVAVETKTKDNVFVNIVVAVQFNILKNKVFEACYTLNDPEYQIKAFVFDLVRAHVPKLELDDVFSKKDDIADAVKAELEKPMSEFGYGIIKALITDINPDKNVKAAMNEINTAQRLRVAAAEKGEADRILRVKQAEAEAEASILHGKGIAGQRQAIIEGLGHSEEGFINHIPGADASSVMEMVMLIQYVDTLKEIGANAKSNVVFVSHSPGEIANVGDQIREAVFSANEIYGNSK
jgi:regulator of protease activity HflC (stomatin/prohibitin superfamily)